MNDIYHKCQKDIYNNNINIKFFYENFLENRDEIFQNIYDALEKESKDDENDKIEEIIKSKNYNVETKINKIKRLTQIKHLKNLEKNYNPEYLSKFNLGLVSKDNSILLVYYEFSKEGNSLENNNINNNGENNNSQNKDDKNNGSNIISKKKMKIII